MADYIVDSDGNAVSPLHEAFSHTEKRIKMVSDVLEYTSSVSGIVKMQCDRSKEKKQRNKLVENAIKNTSCNELIPKDNPVVSDARKLKVCSDETLSMASRLLSAAVTQGLITETFSGLLKCNIDISKLANSNDGFLRGFVVSGGRISEQAKFVEVPSVSVTPMLAFQIASLVTGQYYQNIITNQLSSISKKVEQILDVLETDDRAEIKNAYEQLCVLAQAERFDNADEQVLRDLNRIAGKLQKKYRELVLGISLEEVERSYIRDKNEAEDWVKALEDSRFIKQMNVAFNAEYLFYCTNILLVKKELAKESPDHGKLGKWAEMADCNFMAPYVEKYHEIKITVCGNLKLLSETAYMASDDIRSMLNNVESQFTSFEQSVQSVLSELSPTCFIEYEKGKPLLEG